MKKILLIITIIYSSIANSSPCKDSGSDIFNSADGSGFVFYVYSKEKDVAFQLPGKTISFPNEKNKNQFYIGKTLYEYIQVDSSEFETQNSGALEILKNHASSEQKYLKSTPSPLKEIIDMGENTKEAAGNQPEFVFYLWKAKDPKNNEKSNQYILTTVISGKIFMLSAISDIKQNDITEHSFNVFTSSFQIVSEISKCPKTN